MKRGGITSTSSHTRRIRELFWNRDRLKRSLDDDSETKRSIQGMPPDPINLIADFAGSAAVKLWSQTNRRFRALFTTVTTTPSQFPPSEQVRFLFVKADVVPAAQVDETKPWHMLDDEDDTNDETPTPNAVNWKEYPRLRSL